MRKQFRSHHGKFKKSKENKSRSQIGNFFKKEKSWFKLRSRAIDETMLMWIQLCSRQMVCNVINKSGFFKTQLIMLIGRAFKMLLTTKSNASRMFGQSK